MALLFGGRLAAAGEEITFLGSWQAGIQAINQIGVRVAAGDTESCFPARATSDLNTLGKFPQALVLVKSWQTERAADQLKQILEPKGIVLTLQNGIGNVEILKEKLGEGRVFQGVTTYGATLLGPGYVKSAGEGVITVEDKQGIQPIIGNLVNSGFSVNTAPSLEELIWEKLAINAAINPLTALLGVKNGDLLKSQAALAIMADAASEVIEVGRAQGIFLDIEEPGKKAEEVAEITAENLSSMLQDINRGAQTEIDAVCGAVVERGKKVQVPTQVNELLSALIMAKVEMDGG